MEDNTTEQTEKEETLLQKKLRYRLKMTTGYEKPLTNTLAGTVVRGMCGNVDHPWMLNFLKNLSDGN